MERLKLNRRDFLKWGARAAAGLGLTLAAGGCGREKETPTPEAKPTKTPSLRLEATKTPKATATLKPTVKAIEETPTPTASTVLEVETLKSEATKGIPTSPAITEAAEPTQTPEIATEEREVNIWEKYFQIVDEEGGIPFKGKGMVNHVETVAPLQIAVLTGGPVEISNRNFPGGSNGEEQGTVVVMLPGEETVQYQMRVWAGANWHRVANVKPGAPSLSELATLVLEDRVKAMVDPEEKNCPAGKGCKIVDFAIVSPDRKIEVGQFPRK